MDGLDGRWWGTDEVPVQSDRGGGLGTLGSRCSVDAGCRAVYYRALQGFTGLYRGGKSKDNSAAADKTLFTGHQYASPSLFSSLSISISVCKEHWLHCERYTTSQVLGTYCQIRSHAFAARPPNREHVLPGTLSWDCRILTFSLSQLQLP
ncbi:hypothetical protein LI328DRAFT_170395 [Trichoderma asperelloides]|nr:hypothetical protein LI328DRAFT_170395 [Trichoderma asperelloides]